jgi:hypothetical protein
MVGHMPIYIGPRGVEPEVVTISGIHHFFTHALDYNESVDFLNCFTVTGMSSDPSDVAVVDIHNSAVFLNTVENAILSAVDASENPLWAWLDEVITVEVNEYINSSSIPRIFKASSVHGLSFLNSIDISGAATQLFEELDASGRVTLLAQISSSTLDIYSDESGNLLVSALPLLPEHIVTCVFDISAAVTIQSSFVTFSSSLSEGDLVVGTSSSPSHPNAFTPSLFRIAVDIHLDAASGPGEKTGAGGFEGLQLL